MTDLLQPWIWPSSRAFSEFAACDVSQRIRLGGSPLPAPDLTTISTVSLRSSLITRARAGIPDRQGQVSSRLEAVRRERTRSGACLGAVRNLTFDVVMEVQRYTIEPFDLRVEAAPLTSGGSSSGASVEFYRQLVDGM